MSPGARRKDEPAKVVVASMTGALQLTLRQHLQTRHIQTIKFMTPGEHEADHRLHGHLLDHFHAEPNDQAQEQEGAADATDED